MKIDRTNYEIWLIDWLDGKLSDQEISLVQQFLDDNPDLKEEFGDLNSISLSSNGGNFQKKESLKRSLNDLPESQFNYLSVAFLENDISEDDKIELLEIAEHNSERKKSFELIQKTRLVPGNIRFQHKSRIIRLTTTQKVIRLSIIGLSAAAAITMLISLFLNAPTGLQDNISTTAENFIPDSTVVHAPAAIEIDPKIEKVITPSTNNTTTQILKAEQSNSRQLTLSGLPELAIQDTSTQRPGPRQEAIEKIIVKRNIGVKGISAGNNLIALNTTTNAPVFEDDRSNVSKFLARTFHQKILGEESSPDRPIMGYEIAEAGVTGLNKLLGWEMALEKNNDENGELSSVYFSSRVLKFNTPVKKSEPLP